MNNTEEMQEMLLNIDENIEQLKKQYESLDLSRSMLNYHKSKLSKNLYNQKGKKFYFAFWATLAIPPIISMFIKGLVVPAVLLIGFSGAWGVATTVFAIKQQKFTKALARIENAESELNKYLKYLSRRIEYFEYNRTQVSKAIIQVNIGEKDYTQEQISEMQKEWLKLKETKLGKDRYISATSQQLIDDIVEQNHI